MIYTIPHGKTCAAEIAVRPDVPADQWPLYGKFEKFVAQVAAEQERRSLDESGITFSFDQYELRPYTYSPPGFVVPWLDLRDAMAAGPPIR